MTATLPMAAILLLAAGTYAFRLAGPLLHERLGAADRLAAPLAMATTVLLLALAATSALTEDQGFAGWSRTAGVLTAALLALRRAPFPVIVLAAAATTALLRLCGIP
ncbi:AzlD domain-containing protein [Actinocorallia populi]|uniref:AzlD domain-containing protein n=1 Tax=Actinocorallia populi TaxID=2079200 RepID=UPI000D089553|nr:AzlD domain-containing protein [Actinocorallia populi]